MLNILPSNRAPIVGVIDPDVTAAGTVTTGWIAVKDLANIMAIVMAGTLGASATLDAKIQEATDGSGTGAQDIAGKAITQLTKAGSDDDKQAVINLSSDELTDGFTHVQLSITVGTASSDSGAVVLGFDARYEPGADLASVAEIVS